MRHHGQVPIEATEVLISLNPKTGAEHTAQCARRLAQLLEDCGLRVETLTDLDEVTQRANSRHRQGKLRALVGVGGDGTAAELANRTAEGVPMTMLSAGNKNLVARYLAMATTAEGICDTIVAGRTVRLDAGKANGRLFLLMVSCGFDAEVVRRVHARRSGRVRDYTYLWPIFASMCRYRYPEMQIDFDDPPDDPVSAAACRTGARWFFGFNLPCYGVSLRFAPDADGSDGLLDVCTFRRGSLWHGLRYFVAVKWGRHRRLVDCAVGRTRHLRITSSAEVPYQLDGDPGGVLPVEIEMVPNRMTWVVPPATAPT
jgi:diacylglycerol kinase family enzyme